MKYVEFWNIESKPEKQNYHMQIIWLAHIENPKEHTENLELIDKSSKVSE